MMTEGECSSRSARPSFSSFAPSLGLDERLLKNSGMKSQSNFLCCPEPCWQRRGYVALRTITHSSDSSLNSLITAYEIANTPGFGLSESAQHNVLLRLVHVNCRASFLGVDFCADGSRSEDCRYERTSRMNLDSLSTTSCEVRLYWWIVPLSL